MDRRILAIGLVAVVVVAVAGFIFLQPKQNQPPPSQGKELVVITRHDSAIQNLFEQAYLQSSYATEYNITSVRFLETPVGYWAATIKNGGVDVAWGGGPTLFNQMLQLGLLQPITGTEALSVVNQLPRTWGTAVMRIDNSQGNPLWVAAAISSFGFTANTVFLHRYNLSEPLLWTDLSSPDFNRDFPTIALAKPSLSTSHTRIYSIILQAFGWNAGWSMLDRIAANGRIYDGSVESQTAVETGEVGVSISIDYYGY
ncbi:MAG TPA: ABC transporter substrate-binding protein, partial [Thermoproteota archaeon]|nr:ABC transporter substrate-binding protein [Thermoproteota archaeon]